MKSWITRSLTGLALVFLASALPAAAQSFSAELDCGGVFTGGDVVPVTLRVESQSLSDIPLDLVVELRIPGIGTRRLLDRSIILGANQDLARTLRVRLPLNARTGSYQGSITATSDSEISFDTCSFQVQ